MTHPRFHPALSILLILAVLLAACQPLTTTTPGVATPRVTPRPLATLIPTATPPAPTQTPSFPADVQRLQGLKLVVWHPWLDELQAALQKEADEFNRTNTWGIQVVLKGLGGPAALENALLNTSDGDLPGLVIAAPESLAIWQQGGGSLFALSTLAEDPEWGLTADEKADFLPGLWPTFGPEEVYFSLPVLRNARFIIYNRSWADELGFSDPPATPDELSEQVCTAMRANLLADYTLRGTGGWLLDNDAYTLAGWLDGFGASFAPSGPDAPYSFSSPAGEQTFGYLYQLISDKCTVSVTTASPEPYAIFAGRRALAYAASLADLPMQAKVNKKLGSQDRWDVLPFPALEGSGVIPLYGLDFGLIGGSSEEELAGWLFIRWLLLARNQVSLALAGGMLPVTSSGLLDLRSRTLPTLQYRELLALADHFQPLPAPAAWRTARRALEDAAWQLYQPYTKAEDIPGILQQLDEMIKALNK